MTEEAIIAGRQAAIELDQTDAAFTAIRDAMVSRLLNTGISEDDARRALVVSIQALDLVKDKLLEAVRLGKDAQALADHAARLVEEGFPNNP